MSSKLSLNLATIRPTPLEKKLRAASTGGFRAVGLLWEEMSQQGEAAIQEVRLSGLSVSELAGISGWMDGDGGARSLPPARGEQAFELAANVGCELVIAWPALGAVDLVAAARQFRELCRLARPFGVKVGLEFVGGSEQVNTLAAAWQIVEAAEAPNGGLVVDSFHFFRGGSAPGMLEPVPGSRILLVQLSDCMELPRHEMRDRHRIYPGQGVLPLEPLLGALRAKGYAGYYSLELHNEQYWREDPVVVAREGLRSMRRLDIR